MEYMDHFASYASKRISLVVTRCVVNLAAGAFPYALIPHSSSGNASSGLIPKCITGALWLKNFLVHAIPENRKAILLSQVLAGFVTILITHFSPAFLEEGMAVMFKLDFTQNSVSLSRQELNKQEERVSEIGSKIVDAATKRLATPRTNTLKPATRLRAIRRLTRRTWKFQVIKSNLSMGVVCPGSQVFVSTGMLSILDDAELASVLGHEVAHVLHNDFSGKALLDGFLYAIELFVLETLPWKAGTNLFRGCSGGLALAVEMLSLGDSRAREFSADRMGLQLAKLAGYDGARAAGAMYTLDADDMLPPALFDTHPLPAERHQKLMSYRHDTNFEDLVQDMVG